MSPYESLIAAIVLVYALNFLFFPHPALKEPPTTRDESRQGLPKGPIAEPSVRDEAPEVIAPEGLEGARREPVSAREAEARERLAAQAEAAPPTTGLFERLKEGLSRTRSQLFRGLDELFLSRDEKVKREEVLELLFETLIRCDVGVTTTEKLVDAVKTRLDGDALSNAGAMKEALSQEMESLLASVAAKQEPLSLAALLGAETFGEPSAAGGQGPHVVMVVGVNGVGKTTTTGKIAKALRDRGHPVVLGAADTFRAAAVDQLRIWAERSGAEFVTVREGSDPAAVAFEAVKRAVDLEAGGAHEKQAVCLVDTAGRLHNRKDLMEELAKVKRVMGKNCDGAPHEVLLIVDATTGQNAIVQARTFREAVDISGLVLTKLDGTAKGGVALAIAGDLGLPIRFVGVGEGVEDLQPFEASRFVQALVGGSVSGAPA